MKLPRIMLAATGSGSGKTFLTCGLLQALLNQGKRPTAFKCGPDYIDPMFHTQVLGVPSRNLDAFFTDREKMTGLFARQVETDLSVVEGVMGYYDGIGGNTVRASTYEVASWLEIPVVLIVDCKGASTSLVPLIKGFLEYKKDSMIQGVILNRVSPMTYPVLKELIERELPVTVVGYVKPLEELQLQSRHLGLITPGEIADFKEIFATLAAEMEESIDFGALLGLADGAPDLEPAGQEKLPLPGSVHKSQEPVRIAVARDEAFSFQYADNLFLLEELGGEIVYFSPLHDSGLPERVRGMILCGGYPEVYAQELQDNPSMRRAVKDAVRSGMPTIAECGGFLYLQEELVMLSGKSYQMAGILKGRGVQTKRLNRFGYIHLLADSDGMLLKKGEQVPAHEFHYFDCDQNGTDYTAVKASGSRSWECGFAGDNLYAGFAHLYYYSYPKMIERFLKRGLEWKDF